MPKEESDDLEATAMSVSYGWGMIPASVQIGETEWETSLWPKDERYIVPLEADVREAEGPRLKRESGRCRSSHVASRYGRHPGCWQSIHREQRALA